MDDQDLRRIEKAVKSVIDKHSINEIVIENDWCTPVVFNISNCAIYLTDEGTTKGFVFTRRGKKLTVCGSSTILRERNLKRRRKQRNYTYNIHGLKSLKISGRVHVHIHRKLSRECKRMEATLKHGARLYMEHLTYDNHISLRLFDSPAVFIGKGELDRLLVFSTCRYEDGVFIDLRGIDGYTTIKDISEKLSYDKSRYTAVHIPEINRWCDGERKEVTTRAEMLKILGRLDELEEIYPASEFHSRELSAKRQK